MVTMEERVSKLEGAYEQVDRRLGRIGDEISELRSDVNSRIDGVGGRIAGVEGRIAGVEGRIEGVEGRIEGLRGEVNDRMTSMDNRMNGMETRLNVIMACAVAAVVGHSGYSGHASRPGVSCVSFDAGLRFYRASHPLLPRAALTWAAGGAGGDGGRGIAAVERAGVMSETRIYWSLRSLLVSRREQFPIFDRLFYQFWNFEPISPRPESDGGPKTSFGQTRTVGRLPRGLGVPEDDPYSRDTVIQLLRTGASARQASGGRDLSSLAEGADAAEIQRIAARMVRALASRPGRRRKRHRRRGVPDLRGAMRLSLATGGDAVRLPRLRRVRRIPRLLLLLDVSGSMDRHARLMLRLAHAVGPTDGQGGDVRFQHGYHADNARAGRSQLRRGAVPSGQPQWNTGRAGRG